MSVPFPLVFLLLLLPVFLFPVPVGVGRGDWLDGVGGQRPHVADGVQEVVPGGQLVRDLRTARLKPLE